jgi:hypothetical protein
MQNRLYIFLQNLDLIRSSSVRNILKFMMFKSYVFFYTSAAIL